MKVEPRELLYVVTEAATELVNEHSEFTEQILIVHKMMIEKIKDKLFLLEVSDLGLDEEVIKSVMVKKDEENE